MDLFFKLMCVDSLNTQLEMGSYFNAWVCHFQFLPVLGFWGPRLLAVFHLAEKIEGFAHNRPVKIIH
jgi:hypothetical protein